MVDAPWILQQFVVSKPLLTDWLSRFRYFVLADLLERQFVTGDPWQSQVPKPQIDDFETNQVTNGGRPGGINTPTPLLWEMSGSFLSPPLPSARLGRAALMSVPAADRRGGHRGRALIDVRRWRRAARSVRTNVDECLGAAAAWNEL